MKTASSIRNAINTDWPSIKHIYIDGIKTGKATLEPIHHVSTWENWYHSKIPNSVFVMEHMQGITAWSGLSATSSRSVYRGVAEVSIYIDKNHYGQGLGTKMLSHLINYSEQQNFWTLQAGIIRENIASIKLHEKCGFRIVGHREKIGKLNDEWRDVTLMERRSEIIN